MHCFPSCIPFAREHYRKPLAFFIPSRPTHIFHGGGFRVLHADLPPLSVSGIQLLPNDFASSSSAATVQQLRACSHRCPAGTPQSLRGSRCRGRVIIHLIQQNRTLVAKSPIFLQQMTPVKLWLGKPRLVQSPILISPTRTGYRKRQSFFAQSHIGVTPLKSRSLRQSL